MAASQEEAAQLIQKYFAQITQGCGNSGCKNPQCRVSGQNLPSNPNDVALHCVQLVKTSGKSALCAEFNKNETVDLKEVQVEIEESGASTAKPMEVDQTSGGSNAAPAAGDGDKTTIQEEAKEEEADARMEVDEPAPAPAASAPVAKVEPKASPEASSAAAKAPEVSIKDVIGKYYGDGEKVVDLDALVALKMKAEEENKETPNYRDIIRVLGSITGVSLTVTFSEKPDESRGDNALKELPVLLEKRVTQLYELVSGVDGLESSLMNGIHSVCRDYEMGGAAPKNCLDLVPLIVIWKCPMLMDPTYHVPLLKSLMISTMTLPPSLSDLLTDWFQSCSIEFNQYLLEVCHQFITLRLLTTHSLDASLKAATFVLGLLHRANERKAKKNRIDFRSFYNDAVNMELNLRSDFLRWRKGGQQGDNFSFCSYPYILSPASKAKVLQYDASAQMDREFQHAIISSIILNQGSSPYLVLKIRRDHVIEDALAQLTYKLDNLKKPLKVHFQGEEGIDEGGVQKEFFQLVVREIFDAKYGMFTYDPESRYTWFEGSSFDCEPEYQLIGMILGLAIYNGVILDVHFPPVVYKKLLEKDVGSEDLAEINKDLVHGLQKLLEYEETEGASVEDVFQRTFQVEFQSFGETVTHDLKANGGEIPITAENREEYVRLHVEWELTTRIAAQYQAFHKGFHMVCGGDALELFQPEELELLICGNPVLDFQELENVTQYEGYEPDSKTVKDFWEVLHSLSLDLKKKFLFFCTGCDRAPINGLGDLPLVIAKNGGDTDRLPTSHTCFYVLMLPEYATKDKLKERLVSAIENAEGFGLQ